MHYGFRIQPWIGFNYLSFSHHRLDFIERSLPQTLQQSRERCPLSSHCLFRHNLDSVSQGRLAREGIHDVLLVQRGPFALGQGCQLIVKRSWQTNY